MAAKEKLKKKRKHPRAVIEEIPDTPQAISDDKNTLPPPQEPASNEALSDDKKTPVESNEVLVQKEKESNQNEITNDKDDGKPSFLSLFILTISVAVIVAIIAGGVYVFVNGLNDAKKDENSLPKVVETPIPDEPSPSPKSSPVATASATPKPANYKIIILNGSGKMGEAGKAKALLEKSGFKITSTGNAKTYDYKETVVEAKASVPSSTIEAIKTALTGYKTTSGTPLDAKAANDIVITIGSN